MPLGKAREKILNKLARGKSTHRYTSWRWIVALVGTGGVSLLSLTNTLRFDFWGGKHYYLGQEMSLVEVTKAFAFPFLAINILIAVASRSVGRYLCGFGCPVGALSRLGDWSRWQVNSRKHVLMRLLGVLGASLILAVITFGFWVDWRVFVHGSTEAQLIAGGFLLGLVGVLFVGAYWAGLRFCREWCPSGVYFALLGPETYNAIELSTPETCIDCKVCDRVCPMDLTPRNLGSDVPRGAAGFYPAALSNYSLCIRCGDCVKVCDAVTEKQEGPTPLTMGFLSKEAHGDAQSEPGEERTSAT
ncbi:MAG: hypothetical protein GY711_13060 [bacterium]|nr:hypothetical protein [bacterium]